MANFWPRHVERRSWLQWRMQKGRVKTTKKRKICTSRDKKEIERQPNRRAKFSFFIFYYFLPCLSNIRV
jgi:hypothetical protein